MPDIFDEIAPAKVAAGGDIFDQIAPEPANGIPLTPERFAAYQKSTSVIQPRGPLGETPGSPETGFTEAIYQQLPKDIGTALHKVGSGIYEGGVAALQHNIEDIAGLPPDTADNPGLTTEQATRKYPKPVQAGIAGARGLVETAPQLAIATVSPVAGALAFGMTPEGFDPKQAAIALALPTIGKWTGAIVETMAARAGVTSDAARLAWSKLGGATGAAGAIGAAQAYAISQLPPEQREQAWVDAAGNIGSMFILGTLSEHKRPNVEGIVEPNKSRKQFVDNLPGQGKPINVDARVSPVEPAKPSAPKDIFDEVAPEPISQSPSPISSVNSDLITGKIKTSTPGAVQATSPAPGASTSGGAPNLVTGALNDARQSGAVQSIEQAQAETQRRADVQAAGKPYTTEQALNDLGSVIAGIKAKLQQNQIAPKIEPKPTNSETAPASETLEKGGDSNGTTQRQGQEVLNTPAAPIGAAGSLQQITSGKLDLSKPTMIKRSDYKTEQDWADAVAQTEEWANDKSQFEGRPTAPSLSKPWTGVLKVVPVGNGYAVEYAGQRVGYGKTEEAAIKAAEGTYWNFHKKPLQLSPETNTTATTVPTTGQVPSREEIGDRPGELTFPSKQRSPARWTPTNGQPAIYVHNARSPGKLVTVIQAQPDGSAPVLLKGEKTYRPATAQQLRPTNTEINKQLRADELAGVSDPAKAVADAKEFSEIVEEYAPQLGIVDAQAYKPAALRGDGIANEKLRVRAREAMAKAAGVEMYQDNMPTDRARALPKVEAYLRQQFPGDNSIAKRRALEQFSRSEPETPSTPEQRARAKQDAAHLRRIAAQNPAEPLLRGLSADQSRSGTDATGSKLPVHAGGRPGVSRLPRAAETKAVRELERIFGVRIIFVSQPGGAVGFNGFRDRHSNVILLNVNAKTPSLVIAGHELLHHIKLTHPGLYAEMLADLRPLLQNTEAFKAALVRRDQATANMEEELIADFMGDNFGRKEFWDDLNRREPNLFKRLARIVKGWLDKLIAKLKGAKPKGFESEQYFTDLEHARDVVANALVEAAMETQYRRAGIQQEGTEGAEQLPGKFSKRDDSPGFFDAPESVEEQRARLNREKSQETKAEARKTMEERAGARLTGSDIDTTKEMFGAEVKQDKSGQGSLFSKQESQFPERFALAKPIKGPNGASIVGYEWRSTMGEKYSAREGGMVDARVSDWDNADESTGTGRAIVHVFYVEHPNGTVHPEGIRSAQTVLGINESRLMTIAKKERAAQQYRQDQERAEMANYEKAAVPTSQEAARNYRKWNYSPMRTFEENDALFNDSALFEKDGKFIRRNWNAAERMRRNGWTLVKDDPARTGGTAKAIAAVRESQPEIQSGGGLEQGSLFSKAERERGPLWRSNIQDALESWQNKGTPEQLRAHLAKTKGAMDEAEWIGLDDFLKDKPSVTKQQVAEFVQANTVDVQEVTKSQRYEGDLMNLETESLNQFGKPFNEITDAQRASLQREQDEWLSNRNDNTKFSQYQLPGGENYRELLLTLPGIGKKLSVDLQQASDGKWYAFQHGKKQFGGWDTKEQAEASSGVRSFDNAREQFRSSHFDEPNILAHVRFNERTDADGKRVLFIEEVQSDWHQKGRKEGYASKAPVTPEAKDAAFRRIGQINEELSRLAKAMDRASTDEERDPLKFEYGGYLSEREAIHKRIEPSGIPDAPFKQTWPMLAMKRMIRYASENGFDRIAWTTGEQQAERYDLSKQVDSIDYGTPDGQDYTLAIYKSGIEVGESMGLPDSIPAKDLEKYVGKDIAKRIVDGGTTGKLQGDDLKVGGEGMKGFYDKILPGEVNKFVKKWGGRVGLRDISVKDPDVASSPWTVTQPNGMKIPGRGSVNHSLDITPSMRDAAMQGMPLFSKPEKSVAELQDELKQAADDMKSAIRVAGDPKRGISKADAEQAKALATAKYREIEDALNRHPDRFKDLSLADLKARQDEIQSRLTELGSVKHEPGNKPDSEARGERWRLLKEARALDRETFKRPELVADVLKRSEALTKDLRSAKASGDTTAARHAVEDLMALQEGELARIDPNLIEKVRAELVAKGELEPLTPTSARTLGDLTAWLKANKIESPGMSIKDRLNLAGRLAAEWTQGKTKLEAGLAKSRAIWQAFKAQWRSPKTDDEVRSIFKEWHFEKQFSGLETHQWIQRIRADIPQKIRRNAISVWLDADGDKGLLTFQRDAVPEKYRAVWQTALNLTPSEQAFARQIKADFASKLTDGQLLGLIGKGRQDYGVPQVWAKPPEHGENYNPEAGANRAPRNPLAKLDPRDPFFALERTHDSYFDGIMANGVPKSLDISDLVGVYNVDFHGALADRSVIKALKDAKMPDGSPAVMISGGAKIEVNATGRSQFVDSNWRPKDAVTKDGRPYQTIDHWALRGWTFGAKDTAGNPIMVKGDFLVHPDLYRDLKTQLEGKSALRDPNGPLGDIAHITKAMLESGAYLKASKFAAATFHGATLAEHMMTHAFSGKPSAERLGLINPWVGGVEIDPAKNIELANLMRHGMDLGFGGSRMLFEEGLSSHGGILSKVPGLGDGLAWLSNGLFQEYLPRLKVKMGSVLLHANLKRYSKKSLSGPALTEQQIYELTASQVNAAFGGQNWKLMGRSRTFLDVNRLLFTAPDFLLSRAKVVGQAGKPYHAEQRYFLLAQAALVYAAARILNYLLDDGDPHWEAENALRVIHKGRAYSARFIVNDIGHLMQDPAGFAGGRLGPWPKAIYESITGRDMRSGARIELPFKTENGALNAAQIMIKDLAMWGLPIGTEGFLPGATGREQTTLGQFGVGLLGVGSQRYTPETEMYDLAAKFNRNSPDPKTQLHQQERDDAVKQASVYRKMDVLLEAGDFKAARKEYDALIAEGHTVIGIKQRYNATTGDHLARPFSGSVEREKKFKATLTPEQLQEYQRAVEMRKQREKAFQAMLNARF